MDHCPSVATKALYVVVATGALAGAALANAAEVAGSTEGPAFAIALVDSMRKVPRTGPGIEGILAGPVRLEAAQDETESFQIVVIANAEALEGVTVQAPPLEGPGNPLAVEWHPVGYVKTGKPKHYEPAYVGWWPDVLMPPAPFDVSAGHRQPVWIRITVPPDAAPGVYSGEVTVRHGDQPVSAPVELRVRNFRLRRPGALACPFGLYAHALSGWYHGKEPYRSAMPIETYARWCAFMGQYRLTPKNIANEYFETVKDDEGTRLDLTPLQSTVGTLASRYYPPYSFCVYRLPCPREVREGTTKQDPAVWVDALKRRAAEYRRLDLPRQAYVYGIDEPSPQAYPFVRRVYEMVREATPDFPIMQTVNHGPPTELADLVDIWCPLSARVSDDFYAQRKRAGDTLWMYVCCGPKPPHANFFVDEPAVDHRVLFWQARQAGATGLLYWCICWWHGLPGPATGEPHFPDVPIVLEGRSKTLVDLGVNGDGILVWPGPDRTPYPSLRLEVVRDGIEDYEYLALLSRCVEGVKALGPANRPSSEIIEQAEALCRVPETISRSFTDYTKDPDAILARRKAVGDMIEKLSAILGDPRRPQ